MTSPETILRKTSRRTVEILLWCGAGLGALSIVAALVAVIFGIVPLVFTSGSMSPEVPTGSLGLARTVDASELRAGDVVSVTADSGTRVTHRIVATEKQSDAVVLTLKGDTNPAPDKENYRVTEADRLFFSVPHLGRVITLLTSPWGMFLGGLAVAALLFWAFRRQPPTATGNGAAPEGHAQEPEEPLVESGRSRADHAKTLTSMMLLAAGIPALLLVTVNSGTAAYFTDTATVTTEGFAAHKLVQPGPTTCTTNAGPGTVTVTTTSTDPRYTYWARAYTGAGVGVSAYKQLTGSPLGTTFSAADFTTGPVPQTTYTFRVHSRIGAPGPSGATGWESEIFRRAFVGYNNAKLACGEAIIPPVVEFIQPTQGFNGDKKQLEGLLASDCTGYGSTNPSVCGTAIDPNGTVVSLQYTISRSNIGTYCWTPGGLFNGYPPGGCGVYRDVARNGDKWSIPGYIYPGIIAWNYTITIRATDNLGAVTEKSIQFRVSP